MNDLIRTYQTRSGPMLALRTDMYITKALELYGEYNRNEWLLLQQLIKPGMGVIEAGANMGSHSVDMARACAPGLFLAFEPQPLLFQILCGNLALANITNALAYPDAVGAAEGTVKLPWIDYARDDSNFGGVSLTRQPDKGLNVRVRTIDDFQLKACGLIKMDVEGFELQALHGAEQTIRRCRPILYVEHDSRYRQDDLIGFVAGLGYELYWHLPSLFSPDNFRGNPDNIFGGIASTNLLCLPKERGASVPGQTPIDPDNWSYPA